MNDAICPECGNDNLISYPVCPACATRWHFPHRAVCLHCEHKREAEQNDASTVRWSNGTYACGEKDADVLAWFDAKLAKLKGGGE